MTSSRAASQWLRFRMEWPGFYSLTAPYSADNLRTMVEPIDWAAAVVEIRRRAGLYHHIIKDGGRSAELRGAMRRDADLLATAIEEASSAESSGHWTKLHAQLEEWIRMCSH